MQPFNPDCRADETLQFPDRDRKDTGYNSGNRTPRVSGGEIEDSTAGVTVNNLLYGFNFTTGK